MISGSSALMYHGIKLGEIKDLDIICTEDRVSEYDEQNCDIIIVPEEIYNLLYNETGCITPDLILTLKMSHLSWDIKWEKTKRHINILVNLGYKPNLEVYHSLKKHWETIHGNKSHLSLNKRKNEFFDDFVTYVVDHDYLHELVSHPNEPIYKKCLKDNEEVLICYDKFSSLSHSDKVRLFREEITVIAIERYLINPTNSGKFTWMQSWNLALKKTIISLTKNWATDFIIHNLFEFSKPEYSYFKYALQTLHTLHTIETKELKMKDKFTNLYQSLTTPDGSNIADSPEQLVYLMCEGDIEYYKDLCNQLQYKHLEQEGGGEGGAEYCYGVFKLGDTIYKAEYQYYSHDGHEYYDILDTIQEVKPVQKTITVYE